jgi:transcriptional regulator with XRE-family HTH domain
LSGRDILGGGCESWKVLVAYCATSVKQLVASFANDAQASWGVLLRMARKTTPPLPFRLHYIREWAAKRGMRQADIVRELDIDKSNVSRWFKGHLPTEENILRLAALFQCEEPAELFRHPDQDWMFRLLRGRSIDEQERIRRTIEAAFPQRSAA